MLPGLQQPEWENKIAQCFWLYWLVECISTSSMLGLRCLTDN